MKRILIIILILWPVLVFGQKAKRNISNSINPDSVITDRVRAVTEIKSPLFKSSTDTMETKATVREKEPKITAGTISQYWRGDKTWQTLPTASTVTYGFTNIQSNWTLNSGYIYKYGSAVSVNMRISFTGSVSPTTWIYVCDISDSNAFPASTVFAGGTPEDANIKENLPVYIDSAGAIYMRPPTSPQTYLININFIK